MKRGHIAALVIVLVLILDQALKIWVKTTMFNGEERPVIGDWFRLHFTENEGMAFGMSIGGESGKLILSLFRIIACGFITYYLTRLIQKGAPFGLVISISLILAGALGNILDSAFYGLMFSPDVHRYSEFLPADGGGYAGFLHGRVVDMLYFPLYQGVLPEWVPFYGGKYFEFFRPVFNIADTSISTGVFAIIIFQRRFFAKPKEIQPADAESLNAETPVEETERLTTGESNPSDTSTKV